MRNLQWDGYVLVVVVVNGSTITVSLITMFEDAKFVLMVFQLHDLNSFWCNYLYFMENHFCSLYVLLLWFWLYVLCSLHIYLHWTLQWTLQKISRRRNMDKCILAVSISKRSANRRCYPGKAQRDIREMMIDLQNIITNSFPHLFPFLLSHIPCYWITSFIITLKVMFHLIIIIDSIIHHFVLNRYYLQNNTTNTSNH